MKVRMFSNQGNVPKLEEEINQWLSQNPANISSIKQSYAYDGNGDMFYTLISIWYKEN